MGTEAGLGEDPDFISCKGCKSDTVAKSWCAVCNLKSCAREKGLDFCYECNEYPCDNLEKFKTDPQYPYHSEVYDNMTTIKKKGIGQWLIEMNSRWTCQSCGTPFSWWNESCKKCGTPSRGYKKP